MSIKPKTSISIDQLSTWGMLRQIKIEELIDKHLETIPMPNENELKDIIRAWCLDKKINSEGALNDWKIKHGLTDNQWNIFISRKWRWSKWCIKNFKKKTSNYYLEKKPLFDKVTYSIARMSNGNLANELYLRIKELNN